jgi:PAS domain S-box-containing protein
VIRSEAVEAGGPTRPGSKRWSDDAQRLLHGLPDGIIVTRTDGEVLLVNAEAARMVTRSPTDLVGRLVSELVPPQDRPHLEAVLEFAVCHGMLRGVPTGLVGGGGEAVPVVVDVGPVPRRDRGIEAVVWTLHEPVDHVAARRRLEESIRELGARCDAKDVLLLAVSHDLRGPLGVVIREADRLSADEAVPSTSRIVKSAHAMRRILSDVCDNDRALRGGLDRSWVDVGALAREIGDEHSADGRLIRTDTAPAYASVDAGLVRRIIENLVGNAVDHTPDGTTVWVSVVPSAVGVTLRVEDDGPGIPGWVQRRGTDAPPGGRGSHLGLHLVECFVGMHGGWMTIHDRPKGGTIVEVELPHSAPVAPDTRAFGRKRALQGPITAER